MLMLKQKPALTQKLKLVLKPELTQVSMLKLQQVLIPRLMPMPMLKQWIKVMLMLRLRNEIMDTFSLHKMEVYPSIGLANKN